MYNTYVYIYILVAIWIFIYIYIYMYIYLNVFIYIYIDIRISTCLYIYGCMHAWTYACIRPYICTYFVLMYILHNTMHTVIATHTHIDIY